MTPVTEDCWLARDDEFTHITELLASVGPVVARRMFGGAGLFLDGVMFGLIASGELYFKVGAENEALFRDEGMQPFTFTAKGRSVEMSYWRAPERLYDDQDEMTAWARTAIAAARKAKAGKPASPKTKTVARKTSPARQGRRRG